MSNISQSRLHDLKFFFKSSQDSTLGQPTETRDVLPSGSGMAVLFLQKTFHLAHFLPSPWSKKGKLKLDARVLYIFFPFFFFQKLQWWDYGFHRGPLRSKQQNEGFSHHIWGPLRWAKAAEPSNRSDWWQQYVFKTETCYFFFPYPNLIYTNINNLLGSSTPLSCAKSATSACV